MTRHGAEAIEKILEGIQALIITDLIMPAVDGYTLINKIKVHVVWKDIPIIVFPAITSQKNIQQAYGPAINMFTKNQQLPR